MKLSSIHQIEITNRCNLACIYCVHRIMKRKQEDMTLDIFEKTLELCKFLWRRGTQQELWLHGLGESLLHPEFLTYCELARKKLPGLIIRVSTNGVDLTKEHCEVMRKLEIRLHISMHKPELLQKAPTYAHDAGILEFLGCNPVTEANDWAGQVEWRKHPQNDLCGWLVNGWGLAYANGDITTCCVDCEGDGIIGHINQPIGELVELEMKPYKLCPNCNLTVPEGI